MCLRILEVKGGTSSKIHIFLLLLFKHLQNADIMKLKLLLTGLILMLGLFPAKASLQEPEKDNTEQSKAQKDFAEAAAQYGRLSSEYKRAQTLFEQQVSAEKEFRNVQSDYQMARARYRGLKLKIEALSLSPEKIEAGEFFAAYPVKTPIAGRVSALQLSIGSHTDGSAALATVIDPDRLQLHLKVFPNDLEDLREGQIVRYRLANSDSQHIARLHSIGSAVNQDSKAVDCYAALSEHRPQGALADQFVSAIIVTQSDSIQALPSEAILQTEKGQVVLMLHKQDDEGYLFVSTPIKTGRQYNSYTEILEAPAHGQFLMAGLYNMVL